MKIYANTNNLMQHLHILMKVGMAVLISNNRLQNKEIIKDEGRHFIMIKDHFIMRTDNHNAYVINNSFSIHKSKLAQSKEDIEIHNYIWRYQHFSLSNQ